MPGDLAGRVVAPVLALHIDTGQLQRQRLFGLLRTQVPFQVQEFLVHAACNTPHELLRVYTQHTCELRYAVDCRSKFLGVCPDAVDGRADCQRFTVAIGNRAAVRRDFLSAKVTRVGLLVEEILIEYLQLHRTCHKRHGNQREEHTDQRQSAGETPCSLLFCFGAACHGRSIT